MICGRGCLCHGCTNVNILPKENLPEADEGTSSTCSSDLETDDHSISENDEHLEEEIIPDDLYFGNYDII